MYVIIALIIFLFIYYRFRALVLHGLDCVAAMFQRNKNILYAKDKPPYSIYVSISDITHNEVMPTLGDFKDSIRAALPELKQCAGESRKTTVTIRELLELWNVNAKDSRYSIVMTVFLTRLAERDADRHKYEIDTLMVFLGEAI